MNEDQPAPKTPIFTLYVPAAESACRPRHAVRTRLSGGERLVVGELLEHLARGLVVDLDIDQHGASRIGFDGGIDGDRLANGCLRSVDLGRCRETGSGNLGGAGVADECRNRDADC